jgi:hypothetical protein
LLERARRLSPKVGEGILAMNLKKTLGLSALLVGCAAPALEHQDATATHEAVVAPKGLPAPAPAHFQAHTEFKRALFATDKACEDAMRHFGVNCFQEISLEPDGSASVIVTDILNVGTYTIDDGSLTVTLESLDGDPGTKLHFTLRADRRTMTDDQKNVWSVSLCGVTACGVFDYCETVNSDEPEFDGSFTRHACRALPGCDTSNVCECLAAARCDVSGTKFGGTCDQTSGDFYTFTCNLGG